MKINSNSILKYFSFTLIISGIVITIGYFWLIGNGIISQNNSSSFQNSSMIGDFIGGVVGALWSLAGVLLFYIALTYQTKEIKNQEAQIALQREELQNQIIELRETRDVYLLQNFENTFFNLLRNQREIVNSIEFEFNFSDGLKEYNGVRFFDFCKSVMISTYNFYLPDDERKDGSENLQLINRVYSNILKMYQDNDLIRTSPDDEYRIKVSYEKFSLQFYRYINHYFRHLNSILKFLKEHEVDIIKYRKPLEYARMLRSQMTGSEIFLVFYNGIYFPKTKALLEEFEIIKSLYLDDLIIVKHGKFYKTNLKFRYEERIGDVSI